MMSIIIPVLNEQHGIFNLLELLKDRADDPNALEFIIVDGGSIDNTIKEIKRFSKK